MLSAFVLRRPQGVLQLPPCKEEVAVRDGVLCSFKGWTRKDIISIAKVDGQGQQSLASAGSDELTKSEAVAHGRNAIDDSDKYTQME